MEAMAREGRRRAWLLGALMTLAFLSVGCSSTLNSRYYLMAHDPETEVTNYFRVSVHGRTRFSKSKYSVGLYDRSAVEKLFGESAIQREFLATRLEGLDAKTEGELQQLANALREARTSEASARRARLVAVAGTVAAVSGGLEARLRASGEAPEPGLLAAVQKARGLGREAEALLEATGKEDRAEMRLSEAQAWLEGVRVGLDGEILVRFFDGAGNELPVVDRSMVIFVASDVSRFAEALRQLATSAEAQQDLLRIVLGKKIQEAELAASRLKRSDTQLAALDKRLGEITKDQAVPTGRKDANDVDLTGAALEKKQKEDLAALRRTVLKLATAVAGTGSEIGSAEEIRGFVAGSGGGQ